MGIGICYVSMNGRCEPRTVVFSIGYASNRHLIAAYCMRLCQYRTSHSKLVGACSIRYARTGLCVASSKADSTIAKATLTA
eukprot:613167-Rhodomonas_salina.2